jgi:hypothetical protein
MEIWPRVDGKKISGSYDIFVEIFAISSFRCRNLFLMIVVDFFYSEGKFTLTTATSESFEEIYENGQLLRSSKLKQAPSVESLSSPAETV